MAFDFEELEAQENDWLVGKDRICVMENCDQLENQDQVELEPLPSSSHRKKSISRARAWFEIRRLFDAEPQRHYGNAESVVGEWKTYYAKELIIKETCEKLQRDGFVVIDALLAPEYFQQLVGKLLLEAPEQAAALQDHASSNHGTHGRAVGWVGYKENVLRAQKLAELDRPVSSRDAVSVHVREAGLSGHDRALCESCLLSLAHDHGSGSALRPHTPQQFFGFLKAYVHTVAANSMAREKVRDEQKIPVQFCFGNISRPSAAIMEPPQPLGKAAIEGN